MTRFEKEYAVVVRGGEVTIAKGFPLRETAFIGCMLLLDTEAEMHSDEDFKAVLRNEFDVRNCGFFDNKLWRLQDYANHHANLALATLSSPSIQQRKASARRWYELWKK